MLLAKQDGSDSDGNLFIMLSSQILRVAETINTVGSIGFTSQGSILDSLVHELHNTRNAVVDNVCTAVYITAHP